MKKLNKQLIAVIVIVFLVLGLIMAVPATYENDKEYMSAITSGDTYYKKKLCVKAVSAYKKAAEIEDTLEVNLKLVNAYIKGFENGEITSYYDVSNEIFSMIDDFREDVKAYEAALEFFLSIEEYTDCATVLYQAEDFNVKSEKIDEIRNTIRYKYEIDFNMYQNVSRTQEGTYIVSGEKFGLLDSDMSTVIGRSFDYASPYTCGGALVKTEKYTYLASTSGTREAYLDNKVTEATGIGENLIACKIGDNYSYYNLSGEKVFGEYKFAGRFLNGIAAVSDGKNFTLINTDGKSISNIKFSDVKLSPSYDCTNAERIIAKTKGKYELYDLTLNKISTFSCDDMDYFIDDKSWAAFKSGEKWGFVDINGEIKIEPKYDEAKSFSNGLAAVRIGEEWVFINTKGKTVIKGDFTDAGYFDNNGRCFVKGELYWRILNLYYVAR